MQLLRNAPLDVTVKEAGQVTRRPRHVRAALYHARQAAKRGLPPPPGCDLKVTQEGGRNKATLIDFSSLLVAREEWNRGLIPPPMPSEEKESVA